MADTDARTQKLQKCYADSRNLRSEETQVGQQLVMVLSRKAE